MKVIFLDVDGVLNSARSCLAFKGYPFPDEGPGHGWEKLDPIAVSMLDRVCRKTGAVCVLSSSWRIGADEAWLKKFGDYLGVSIIDKTSEYYVQGEVRGNQIQQWLDGHSEVTHWAILDDDSDMLPGQAENFVKVNHRDGFSYQNNLDLIRLLGGENLDAQ